MQDNGLVSQAPALQDALPKYNILKNQIRLTLVGNWTVTLSINFSGAQLILSAITLWNADFVATPYQTILTFWAVMLIAFLVNAFGVKYNYLDHLNKLCIYWTGASVVIIMITILVMSPTHRSTDFVFIHFDASASGWPSAWAWFVGLLQAAYTLTGYGMVASMCEEVQNPQREVPRAMVLSVVAAGMTGLLYLIPILFILPPIPTLLAVANGQPIGLIFATATGSAAGGFGLLFLLLGILFFAGVGALTASSRCTYAFARDNALPFSNIISKISPSLSIPLNALILSTVIDSLLGLIYFGSSAAFNSFTGCATICLSTSYGIPILVSLLRNRKAVRHSSFSLGKFGPIINAATLLWIALAIVIFCMPTAIPVVPSSMNYASVVFAFFAAASVVWYVVSGRKNFKGPPVSVDVEREDTHVVGVVLEDGEVVGKITTSEGTAASESDVSAKVKKAGV